MLGGKWHSNNLNDETKRKAMINIFLQAIYLWDNKMTMILNGGDKPLAIDGILLDEIEANAGVVCSHMRAAAPPNRKPL